MHGQYRVELIDFLNFPLLYLDQPVEIEVTKHAFHPLNITPKGPAGSSQSDLDKALEILKNFQKK